MITIAGGIILAVVGLVMGFLAIVYWPVTLAIAGYIAFVGWLSAHGLIR